jgi:bifunctional non-homologous end joining protein LigD
MPEKKTEAAFIEPMLLLRTEKLAEGPSWLVELKFDGYRALAIKDGGKVRLRSRNDKDFNSRYPAIVKALTAMPDQTVIDGEIVCPRSKRQALLQPAAELRLCRKSVVSLSNTGESPEVPKATNKEDSIRT